jgi:hypothetical protein
MGTSKNRRYSFGATELPANDSASFPFRFIYVHAGAARDRCREQFFEVVPLSHIAARELDISGLMQVCLNIVPVPEKRKAEDD